MSSSEPEQPLESPVLQNPSISPETKEKPLEKEKEASVTKEETPAQNGEADEEEEEEGECGFCLFMKGGGCKDTFTEWEKCIDEAEKKSEDIVEKCFQATAALKKCMEAHSDYYEPILRAEKAAEEDAIRELKDEEAASNASTDVNSDAIPELEKEEAASNGSTDVNSGSIDPEQKIKEVGESS